MSYECHYIWYHYIWDISIRDVKNVMILNLMGPNSHHDEYIIHADDLKLYTAAIHGANDCVVVQSSLGTL